MRRRELLGAGLSVGLAGLAGCSAVLGESGEARDRIESGSEKLLDARDELVTQYGRFGTLESEVDFDAEGVRSTVESAREDFDEAERAARLDGTRREIENLKRLTAVMATAVEVGAGLASAYNTTRGALESYDEGDYSSAVGDLEDASNTLSAADERLQDAEGTTDEIDPEAISSIDLDLEALQGLVADLDALVAGYALLVDGFTPFAKGVREFTTAEAEFDVENYGAASDAYGNARGFFDESNAVLTETGGREVVEELRPFVTGLGKLATVESALSATLGSLSRSLAAFSTAQSYIDASRYDDAVTEMEAADDDVSEARDHLERARSALDEVEAGDGSTFDEIEVQQTRGELDRAAGVLATLDEFVTGMGDYIEGTQALESGVADAEDRNYSAAASHFGTAAVRFGDALTRFRSAEDQAGQDLKPTIVDLVCFTGALEEASRLYSEGYSAAANGNNARANRKLSEAQTALEQCESGSSASLALPPTAARPG